MGLGSHVSVVLVLGVDESLDDSSVQFLALYAQTHADIPLFPFTFGHTYYLRILDLITGLAC
jgi:hypothetical protein